MSVDYWQPLLEGQIYHIYNKVGTGLLLFHDSNDYERFLSKWDKFFGNYFMTFAYCLIPKLQIERELTSGELVDITPGFLLSNRIYWHHWQLETGILQEISQAIVSYAQANLPQ